MRYQIYFIYQKKTSLTLKFSSFYSKVITFSFTTSSTTFSSDDSTFISSSFIFNRASTDFLHSVDVLGIWSTEGLRTWSVEVLGVLGVDFCLLDSDLIDSSFLLDLELFSSASLQRDSWLAKDERVSARSWYSL